jgi:hypothetical protein
VSCSMRYSASSAMNQFLFVGVCWRGYGRGYAAVLSPVKSIAEYSLSFESRW